MDHHPPQTLRAVIWIAVSSKSQADDKVSLEEQERLCRAFAADHHLLVIDVLAVRGHSRAEPDIFTLFESYAAINEHAYHRLRQHWQSGDFDVLLAFHVSRLGRSFTIQSLILENAVRQKRRAHFIQGGWVDETNVDFFIASSGISSKSESRYRVQITNSSIARRVERGLHPRGIMSVHQPVYDQRGKQIALALRPERLPMLNAAADLLLTGIGWRQIPYLLADQGFLNPRNHKPYSDTVLYRIFHCPYTWGVAASHYTKKEGVWAFDESFPPPPGAVIFRNPPIPIPPVWTGERAEQIKAELIRRAAIVAGRTSTAPAYHLTGILRCANCGHRLAADISKSRPRLYWRCPHARPFYPDRCTNRAFIRNEHAQATITRFLQRYARLNRDRLTALISTPAPAQDEFARLTAERAAAESQIAALIDEQSRAPETVRRLYAEQITAAAARLEYLQSALHRVQQQIEPPDRLIARLAAFDTLITDLDTLWDADPLSINRLLVAFLGSLRFLVQGREIVDIG